MPHLSILGTRGIPAQHGGFETFAERLALFLCKQPGWTVTVYCQGSPTGELFEDEWDGIRRIHIPVQEENRLCTVVFDVKATRHAGKEPGTILTLGYNTGFLCIWLWWRGRTHFVNMDGIEWKRAKYPRWLRAWFWFNEHLAAVFATGMIADHPGIAAHLCRSRYKRRALRTTTIVYGADGIDQAPESPLATLDLRPGMYFTLIARPEPENSILEIVQAFATVPQDIKLVVLGSFNRKNQYQAKVLGAAGDNVIFPGGIYDKEIVASLRYHSIAYLHGHRVGGTNPSLVEALGAGNAVIAHDNCFNRQVAGDSALYFSDSATCAAHINFLIDNTETRAELSGAARRRWAEKYQWEDVLGEYQALLAGDAESAPVHRRWWLPWRSPAHAIDTPSLTPSSA